MKKLGYLAAALAFPFFVSAQVTATNAGSIGQGIISLINNVLVPLVFAIAFIVFIWGVFQYFIMGGADEEKRENGKSLMLWGIIGFFVMVSVWGLVNILRGTFQTTNTAPPVGDVTPSVIVN
ncbi:MAG TPA: pilin [Candidatus Paceibacterota bacterium]